MLCQLSSPARASPEGPPHELTAQATDGSIPPNCPRTRAGFVIQSTLVMMNTDLTDSHHYKVIPAVPKLQIPLHFIISATLIQQRFNIAK